MSVRAGPLSDADLERRISAAIIATAAILLFLFLVLAPPASPTFDDAKYIGIGRNVLAGNGPRTLVGGLFLKHSPVWPVFVAFPQSLLGIAPLAVGHLTNAASAALVVALVGIAGWRARPAAGAIGSLAVMFLPQTFALARTGGIDFPSIALSFVYLLVGWRAVERGSLRLGVVAGVVFALAFLIKETIIPFAPVPFIVGVLWGRPWSSLARVAAATLGVAAVGCSWWFILYVGFTGRIYRAEFLPAWLLIPVGIAVVGLVVGGLAAERIAARVGPPGSPPALGTRLLRRVREHGRGLAGWGLTAAWLVVLYVFFSKTPKLLGASLLDPDQVRYFLEHSLLSIRAATFFSLGAVLLIGWRPAGDGGRMTVALTVAGLCGIPLILLVLGVGETPRHYLAVTFLWILLGAIGWVTAIDRVLVARDRRAALALVLVGAVTGAAGLAIVAGSVTTRLLVAGIGTAVTAGVVALGIAWWLARRGRLVRFAIVGVLTVATVGVVGFVGYRTIRLPPSLESAATAAFDAWLRDHVKAGETVAIGHYLSMAIPLDLPAGIKTVEVRQILAIADPTSPLGLRSAGGGSFDWVAVDVAAGKANQFNVYGSSLLVDGLRESQASYYVYVATEGTSLEILNILVPANGFEEVATLSQPGPRSPIVAHVFRVDQARLAVAPDRLYISAEALSTLTDRLERAPGAGKVVAANLLARIVPAADGSLDPYLARLRALATP